MERRARLKKVLWKIFLAVQDSSRGDLVTHLVINQVSWLLISDYNDYNDYNDYDDYNNYND